MNYEQWKEYLTKENISEEEHALMVADSCEWGRCALGAKFMCDLKKDGLLPPNHDINDKANDFLDRNFQKFDDKIRALGNDQFPKAILYKNYERALEILEEIYNTENVYGSLKEEFQTMFRQ